MQTNEQEKQRRFLEKEQNQHPELFRRPPVIDSPEYLRAVGIDEEQVCAEKPLGYIKLYPHDFVVEEITAEGKVIAAEISSVPPTSSPEGRTHYADLIKLGQSTIESKRDIAAQVGIPETAISYAGVKDKIALTAQQVALRDVPERVDLAAIQSEHFFLQNIRRSKGVLLPGGLQGNRFTIAVRSDHELSEPEKASIDAEASALQENGFWNFFSFQRFVIPRLVGHIVGRGILKGNYEETVKLFITQESPRELPYFRNIRRTASERWGDWSGLHDLFSPLSSMLSSEATMLAHLAGHPGDFIGALTQIADNTRLFVYGYNSYLFNKKLSDLIQLGKVPPTIPFATSNNRDNGWYTKELAADGITLPSKAYRDLPFIKLTDPQVPTVQRADMHGIAYDKDVVCISFSLAKGAYATSLLTNLFTLVSDLPIPTGISTRILDPKAVLKQGSLLPVLERFRTQITRWQENLQKNTATPQ